MMVGQTNIAGMWMGDEPEILGFPSNQLCALATSLKRELAIVGRQDVFLYLLRGTYMSYGTQLNPQGRSRKQEQVEGF